MSHLSDLFNLFFNSVGEADGGFRGVRHFTIITTDNATDFGPAYKRVQLALMIAMEELAKSGAVMLILASHAPYHSLHHYCERINGALSERGRGAGIITLPSADILSGLTRAQQVRRDDFCHFPLQHRVRLCLFSSCFFLVIRWIMLLGR
jgi:hypothetical protein